MMFIYCADPSHPKRVAVTNFEKRDGVWREIYARHGARDSAQTIRSDNTVLTASSLIANDDELDDDETSYRARHRLECRKCKGNGKGRPLPLREPVLFDALDKAAAAGYDSLDLSDLAAIVERSSGA